MSPRRWIVDYLKFSATLFCHAFLLSTVLTGLACYAVPALAPLMWPVASVLVGLWHRGPLLQLTSSFLTLEPVR